MKTLLAFGLLFFLGFKHPFYLSVTDLKYNEKEKALQGSVKIFVNDLEGALKKQEGRTIDLINPKDTVRTKKLLNDYLKKHLNFKINGKVQPYSMLGFEQEQEAIWVYIEAAACPFPKKTEIENTILYDFISGQANIVHLEVKGERKSFKVDNPEKLVIFEF